MVNRLKRKLRALKYALVKQSAAYYLGGTPTYEEDCMATRHACNFMGDSRFIRAYNLGKATGSWRAAEIHWRAHVVCWAASHAMHLSGDFVECGVNKGGYARMVMDYVHFAASGRTFWLLDTYNGFIDQYLTDTERPEIGRYVYDECYDQVVETFKGLPASIVRGPVPDTLSRVTAKRIAFLSLDMNCIKPEVDAAEFLWPRLVSGAIVVMDDYGYVGHPEHTAGHDAFAAAHGVEVLALPTGQDLIFKP